NRPGSGTTIRMFLSCVEPAARSIDNEETEYRPEQAAPITVLVVDDDPDVRQLLVNSISILGHCPIEAEDGARGLLAIEQTKPDLVLVDFAMPGMNGAEFGKRVRSWFPEMPIVFVTGYADTDMIESAVGEGALILRKPFRSFELKAIL